MSVGSIKSAALNSCSTLDAPKVAFTESMFTEFTESVLCVITPKSKHSLQRQPLLCTLCMSYVQREDKLLELPSDPRVCPNIAGLAGSVLWVLPLGFLHF